MDNGLDLTKVVVYILTLAVVVLIIVVIRKFARIVLGLLLIGIGGGLFLAPGIHMISQFYQRGIYERYDWVQFIDAPIFLGSPWMWVALGVFMIGGGFAAIYSYFEKRAQLKRTSIEY